MSAVDIPLDDLIAHRAPMLFLDRMIAVSDKEAIAEAVVRADNPLFVPGRGLPAYVGLEMMAQAIAAIDGMKRKMENLPPKIGFLLGCRRYSAQCAHFEEDQRLNIVATMVFGDNAMFAFECRIDGADGAELAKANMSVYAPADPLAFLKDGAT